METKEVLLSFRQDAANFIEKLIESGEARYVPFQFRNKEVGFRYKVSSELDGYRADSKSGLVDFDSEVTIENGTHEIVSIGVPKMVRFDKRYGQCEVQVLIIKNITTAKDLAFLIKP